MRSVYEERSQEATNIERTLVQGTARLCSSNFGKCWKALHPHKAAEALAAAIGCSVRAAAYEISGERELSAKSLHALNSKILER